MTALMLLLPTTQANVSDWRGPDAVKPTHDGSEFTAFRVPTNATVLDSWVEISNDENAQSREDLLSWSVDDGLDQGIFSGTSFSSGGEIILTDDFTVSIVEDFDDGNYTIEMPSGYYHSPGVLSVYNIQEFSSSQGCGNQSSIVISHGHDFDSDGNLDAQEISTSTEYCPSSGMDTSVTSLNITSIGSGYGDGNLSASGGGGSGFSGTYLSGRGIGSASLISGGSGYANGTVFNVACGRDCPGSGATVTATSVDSAGAITGIVLTSHGSNYTTDHVLTLDNTGSSGRQADISVTLNATGHLAVAEIETLGTGYTSPPTIVLSGAGTGGVITPGLGGSFNWLANDNPNSADNAACTEGGHIIDLGQDLDNDGVLDPTEITQNLTLCHNPDIEYWSSVLADTIGGTVYLDQRNLSHGVVPARAAEGKVMAATLPGSPVPAGTDTSLFLPPLDVPSSDLQIGYYLSFEHWYHVDSTSLGGGDGAWLEYRLLNGSWGDWSFVEPAAGYPSTLSPDGPDVSGQPSGALPVFASSTHSGWTSDEIDLTTIPGISESDQIQFRFRLWTHPSAQNLRPGWYLDNISYVNAGGTDGGWHHGCSSAAGTTCGYSNNAYGALQTQISTQGATSSSKIRLNVEYDLEGSSFDNYCVELSTNNLTWTDISSTGTATSQNCDDRAGAIPGNTGDQSGGLVIQEFSIPAQFLNLNTVHLRIIVDTDGSVTYGSPQDNFEGVFLTDISLVTPGTAVLWSDDLSTSTTFFHYAATPPASSFGGPFDDWGHIQRFGGRVDQTLGFENSFATPPSTEHASGWSHSGSTGATTWDYGFPGSSLTLSEPKSFPYLYGTGLTGEYSDNWNGYLQSPQYDIPPSGATLQFAKWACMDSFDGDGAVLQYKVNNGGWQYFQPSIPGWYDGTKSSTWNNPFGNNEVWIDDDCGLSTMSMREAPLDQWGGDSMTFRFWFRSDTCCQSSTWATDDFEGFYLDDFGILIPNYSSNGSWLSPSMDITSHDSFNLGYVDVDAEIPDETRVLATIIDSTTMTPIDGYRMRSLPLSLAGLDHSENPSISIQLHLETTNSSLTPAIKSLRVDGFRTLSAASGEGNGWDFSPSVVVENGQIITSGIAGSISSDFLTSSRPIKAVSVTGDYSGVSVTFKDANGGIIGPQSTTGGIVEFPWSQPGFEASISLSPVGSINQLNISAKFAEPARAPTVDLGSDGEDDWSFPFGLSYGHLGWQSLLHGDSQHRSTTLALSQSAPSIISALIPGGSSTDPSVDSTSWLAAGFIAVSPVGSDSLDSPVTISIGSASKTTGISGDGPDFIHLTGQMISAANALQPTITDAGTGREWKEVTFEVSSSLSQTISISTLGLSYYLKENVSALQDVVTESISEIQSNSSNTDVPVTFASNGGMLSIGGGAYYDYITTNYPFNPPNSFVPRADHFVLTTEHSHLYDNSQISSIRLTGRTEGGVATYTATSNDGDWSDAASTVFQNSGDGLPGIALVPENSVVQVVTYPDGRETLRVDWSLAASWGPDDVSTISWTSSAIDSNGDVRWSAESSSGVGGRSAYENDLEIDSFSVTNHLGNLVSDQFSSMYPFPVDPGNNLFIEGAVRFEGSPDLRPDSQDFAVSVNLSGTILPLTSDENGAFHGQVTIPSGINSISLTPTIDRIGPAGQAMGGEDLTIDPPVINAVVDDEPPIAGPIQILTPLGFQNAAGKIVSPDMPLSVYATVSDSDARASNATLRYWRAVMDDANMDGVPDPSEYSSMTMPLSIGFSGEEQLNFNDIDLTGVPFNSPVYMYIEGTDWSGRTYQSGGTGGGPGAEEAWATLLVAEDIETQIITSGYSLNRAEGYLLPGSLHTFKMLIDEPNGIMTLDGIDVMLCDDGPTGLGKMHWNPAEMILSSPPDSHVDLIEARAIPQQSGSILEIQMDFALSWDFPWSPGDSQCSPRVRITDDLQVIAESSLLTTLSWELDNQLEAIPTSAQDLTLPIGESDDTGIYLMKGDSFKVNGTLVHSGSGEPFTMDPLGMTVEVHFIYGSTRVSASSTVGEAGAWEVELSLPDRPPVYPVMEIVTTVIDTPGASGSYENNDISITVDSAAPTILFDQTAYPDSSLSVEESDLMNRVKVTLQINDAVGMQAGDIQVAWVFKRGGSVISPVSFGTLPLIADQVQFDIYQGELDMTQSLTTKLIDGDFAEFWVVSTDRAGNPVNGLGSEALPKRVDIRIMEFLPTLTNTVFDPTDKPLPGQRVTMKTFWSNLGKREGTLSLSLWESKGGDEWAQSPPADNVEVTLEASATSVVVEFVYEPSLPGVPVLYVIDSGDFENLAYPVDGMIVSSADVDAVSSGDSMLVWTIIGFVAAITLAVGAYMVRTASNNRDDDYYEDDEYEDYEEDEEEDYED